MEWLQALAWCASCGFKAESEEIIVDETNIDKWGYDQAQIINDSHNLVIRTETGKPCEGQVNIVHMKRRSEA